MGSYDNIILPVSTQPISVGTFGKPVKDAINDLDTRVGALETTPWVAYTPSWTATSGTPSVGTGGSAGLFGRYKQIGKTVHLRIVGTFGTTGIVLGTGAWGWSIPVAASAVNNVNSIGSAYLRDSSAGSAGHFTGICGILPTLAVNTLYGFNVNAQVGVATPFAWASADSYSFTITYEAA